jgi:hypothetical protein
MDDSMLARQTDRGSAEFRNTFMMAYLSCPGACQIASERLSSLGHDGTGYNIIAIRDAAARYDEPAAAIFKDSKDADALVGYIVDNEVVLIYLLFLSTSSSYLPPLPIYLLFLSTSSSSSALRASTCAA